MACRQLNRVCIIKIIYLYRNNDLFSEGEFVFFRTDIHVLYQAISVREPEPSKRNSPSEIEKDTN